MMTLGWMMIVVVVGGGNVQDTKVEQSTNGIDCRRLGVVVVGDAFTGSNRGVGVAPQDGAQTMNGHEQSMIIGMWWWWWR